MSELIWLTIPGGTTGRKATDQATLRVVITPQLDPGSLGGGMASWPPPELASAPLKVEFAASVGGAVVSSSTINPPHIQAQEGLWAAFFAGAVVTAPAPRRASPPQVSVDSTSQKAQAIDMTFSAVATTDIRADQTPLEALNPVARQQLLALWGTDMPPPTSAPPPLAAPTPFVPPDFHGALALLREHPQVLRQLGLILEITLPVSQLPSPLTGGVVRVSCPSQPPSVPPITAAWTRYSDEFLPAGSPSGNVDNGMVTLTNAPETLPPGSTPRWLTVTVDVDNGAKRLKDAAIALSAAASPSAGFALPALRSNGIALVRVGRQNDFAMRRRRAAAFVQRSLADAEVTADDLVLGYRVDVRVQGGDWQSLNVRDVTYTVSRNGMTVPIDTDAQEEGHIKAHTAIDDGRRNGRLRADEVVTRWTGWSLAVPRPQFAAPADPPAPAINAAMPYQFRWTFGVPDATLPRLRFSHRYQLRARVADLAGGGLATDDPLADRCFTDLVTYLRYEPISSPELSLPTNVDRNALQPGEALDRVVVRSDTDAAGMPLANNGVRVMAPPRSSLTLAEQHGAFDQMVPSQIRDLVLQEQTKTTPPLDPGAILFRDVAAGGVNLAPRAAPGGPSLTATDRAWAEQWPDFKPKHIQLLARVASDHAVIEWQPPGQIHDPSISDRLLVHLLPAEELTLDISSFPNSDLLAHFAANSTTLPTIPPTTLPQTAADAIASGRHPLVSPARTVTFTHAVRCPLATPAGTFTVQRLEGQTFATLVPSPAMLGIDAASSAKLEITASWTDPISAPVTDAPVQTLLIKRGDQALPDAICHEFHDTRHRIVTYAVTAVSRFRQYFDPHDDPELFLAHAMPIGPINIPSSARPTAPAILSVRPAFVWEESRVDAPSFQLTRRRLPGRLRLELKGPWFETGDGEMFAVLFPKSAFPADAMAPYITRAGGDPISLTFTIPPIYPTVAVALGDAPAVEMALPEAPEPVMVVPFRPWLGDTGWFVDVALPGLNDDETNSWPFVELACARYQPDSLPALALSKVVKAELGQIIPERVLSVVQAGSDLTVSLQGARSGDFGDEDTPLNRFTVVLEQLSAPAGTLPDAVELSAIAPAAEGSVPPTTDGLPAWVAVNDNFLHVGAVGIFQGTAGLPLTVRFPIPPGLPGPLRLRIRESEGDDYQFGPLDENSDLNARIIYSDIVMLP